MFIVVPCAGFPPAGSVLPARGGDGRTMSCDARHGHLPPEKDPPVLKLSRAALASALLALGIAACGGDNGSEPRGDASAIDAQLMSTTMSKVDAVLDQPALQAMLGFDDPFVPVAAGARVGAARVSGLRPPRLAPFAAPRAAAAPRLRTAAALAAPDGGIPAELRGRAYLHDVENYRWLPDPSRSGAPANGVRFVLGPTVANPSAVVLGYVDVEDHSVPGAARLVTTIRPPAGATVMTYDDRSSGDPFESPTYTESLAGYVARGTDRLTFSSELTATSSGTALPSELFTMAWALPSAAVSFEAGLVSRNAAGDSSYSVIHIGNRTLRTTNRFVPDTDFGGYQQGDTTRVYVDDRPYALVIVPTDFASDEEVKIVRPNGTPLPLSEQVTLMRHDATIFRVTTLFFVPLIVEGWIWELEPAGGA